MEATQTGQNVTNKPWYLKERHLHRSGTAIFDRLNAVMVCELSEPRVEYVEHEELGIGSKDRDLAEEHAQLILAAPYAIQVCYDLAISVLSDDYVESLESYEKAVDSAIQFLRKLDGKTL